MSANPVYIQGDYNTGRGYDLNEDGNPDNGVNPPSNNTSSDPTQPASLRVYNRAPCSVLADAVTILSNKWDDGAAGTTPPAYNTTVNTAIVAGIVPTNAYGDGNYSGGAENFPRFLEAWDGRQVYLLRVDGELYKASNR